MCSFSQHAATQERPAYPGCQTGLYENFLCLLHPLLCPLLLGEQRGGAVFCILSICAARVSHELFSFESMVRYPPTLHLSLQTFVKLELAQFTLDSILSSPQTSDCFKEFLMGGLCVENYLFWRAAQDYRVLAKRNIQTEPTAVMRSGLDIWRTYLQPGSKFEVSLPSKDFSEVQQHLHDGRFGIYTFAKAQDRAYNDMLQDSMPKFTNSPVNIFTFFCRIQMLPQRRSLYSHKLPMRSHGWFMGVQHAC